MGTTSKLSAIFTQRVKVNAISVLVPLLIIGLALFIRLHTVPFVGDAGDIKSFDAWIQTIQQHGLFEFYNPDYHDPTWDRPYPPLSTLVFALLAPLRSRYVTNFNPVSNHVWVAFLKAFPIICELGLIVAVYFWLQPNSRWRYMIPLLLAIYPAVVATTAWWGQYDSAYSLFLILSLIALNRDRVILAWAMAAIAILLKQPAIFVLPLLFVVCFRRYGLRNTAIGIAVLVSIILAAFAPFVVTEGLKAGFSSYLGADSYAAFSNLTNNAFNLWHIVASIHKGSAFKFGDVGYSDTQTFLGPLTFDDAGDILMSGFVLLLLVPVWIQAKQHKEMVWGGALYLAFFVLPTQIHERYLYPGAVLLLLAASQDRRVLWVALTVMVTFSYNIFQVALSYLHPTLDLWPNVLSLAAAAMNCVLLLVMLRLIYCPESTADLLEQSTGAAMEPAS